MKNKNNTSTYSNRGKSNLTTEAIDKAWKTICRKEAEKLPKGLSWFTKIMNSFGWHRKYEVILIDKSKFSYQDPPKLTL